MSKTAKTKISLNKVEYFHEEKAFVGMISKLVQELAEAREAAGRKLCYCQPDLETPDYSIDRTCILCAALQLIERAKEEGYY